MKIKKLVSVMFVWLLALGSPVSAVTPEGVDAPVSDGVFVTLTRTNLSQRELPTNTEVLKPDNFRGWSAQTAGEAARRLTSVQVQPTGGLGGAQTMQIRGASTAQNLVLIDGRPIGGVSFGGFQDLTEIPVEQIDHLEVVRGGVSALYGPNAVGGVLNVITRRAPSDGNAVGSAGYEYGSYGRNIFRATAGAKAGPFDYFAYGNTQHEDGFRDNSKADTLNAGANLGLALPGASKLLVDGSLYQAELGVPGQRFLQTNQFNNDIERRASSPNAKQNIDTKALRTAYSVPLPMNSLLSLKAWGSERRVIYKDPFIVNTDTLQATKGAEVQVNLPLGLVVGADYIHDREDTTNHLTPSSSFIRWAENYAFFAQDTMKLGPLTLIPSGRFDHHSAFGDTANPRVQLMASALPWLRFSGSAARSFRAPSIDDLYYPFTDFGTFQDDFTDPLSPYTRYTNDGNPNLQPEKAWTYDAGFELYNEVASLKATYFRANVNNLIQIINTFTANSGTFADPNLFASTVQNVGKARRQGLEIQFDHLVNEHFKHGLNYTYLDNVGIPSGFSDYVLLAYSPRHTVNAFATVSPTKAFDWTHTLRYVDKRFSSNNQGGTKLGSMVLWDMRLAYRWQIVESYFQVSDVTDRRYQEQAGFPLPGRTFIGGVTIHFGGPK